LAARLNALMNRPAGSPLPWPEEIVFTPLAPADEEILSRAAITSPELQALDHAITARHKGLELARKRSFPDITLGVNYIQVDEALDPRTVDSGKDALMASVAVDLPIWLGANRSARREAEARLRAAQHARRSEELTLEATMQRLLFECRDAERKLDLYQETLIPIGRQSLQSTQTAFTAGHLGFLEVIDAQRLLLEFELAYERALATHAQRLAEIERFAGPVAAADDARTGSES
jgi:outer membrane protein TolC